MREAKEVATARGKPPTEITIDGREFSLEDNESTPNELLTLAGLDPATHYLVRVEGRSQHSYEGRGGERIHIHRGERFVSVSTGPTPVS